MFFKITLNSINFTRFLQIQHSIERYINKIQEKNIFLLSFHIGIPAPKI